MLTFLRKLAQYSFHDAILFNCPPTIGHTMKKNPTKPYHQFSFISRKSFIRCIKKKKEKKDVIVYFQSLILRYFYGEKQLFKRRDFSCVCVNSDKTEENNLIFKMIFIVFINIY